MKRKGAEARYPFAALADIGSSFLFHGDWKHAERVRQAARKWSNAHGVRLLVRSLGYGGGAYKVWRQA